MADPFFAQNYIDEGQRSAGVTANDFLFLLSAMSHLAIIDRDLTAPPGTIVEGAVYIPAAGASGAWTGLAGKIVIGHGGAWVSYTPLEGWGGWVLDENLRIRHNGTTWLVQADLQAHTKSLSILNPNTGENLTFCYFKRASTIKRVNAVIRGGTSILIQLVQGTDRSAAGTNVFSGNQTVNSTTTGNEFTTFSDATMPAGSWLWLTTSTETGVVNELHVTVEYTEDG